MVDIFDVTVLFILKAIIVYILLLIDTMRAVC